MSIYKNISNFGQGIANNSTNDPLSYCLNQSVNSGFMHGAISETICSASGKNCQAFLSQRCADNWDGVCEKLSNNREGLYPNNLQPCGSAGDVAYKGLTAGEVLIQNTATRKYLVKMLGSGCNVTYQPFDPLVASSPLVAIWDNDGGCVPVYAVNREEIDNDPVMNKILNKPIIAWSLLINIYNTAKRNGELDGLKGTRIYNLFMSKPFQMYIQEIDKNNTPSSLSSGRCSSGACSYRN